MNMTSQESAIKKSMIIFIAVGTPSKPDGGADLSDIENAAKQIVAASDSSYKLIVEKSEFVLQFASVAPLA